MSRSLPYRLGLALALGLLAVLALPAAPASAHAALVRTSPVQGSVVQEAPAEVVITFSEHVTPVRDKIHVIGPDGKSVDHGEPSVTNQDLHIPVRTDGPRGTYLVSYRVISADSHPVGATFSYSVGAPSATRWSTSDSGSGGHTDRAVVIGVATARYLGFVGLVLVTGPVLVLAALWPRRLSRRGPTRLAYLGLGLVAGSTLLGLYLQAPYQNGGTLPSGSPGALAEVVTSSFGVACLVRLAATAVAVPLVRLHGAGRGGGLVRAALAAVAAVGLLTWPTTGHPASSTAPALTVIADAAHLAGSAVWLGGLVMLVGYLLRRADGRELSAILPVWSTWAALAVTVLVLAGTAQALIEVVTLDALLHTTYGKLLLWKIGLLAAVLAAAWVSRRLVRRRLTGDEPDPAAVSRLRRTVLVEIVGAAVILAFAAALVQTAPARTAVASTPGTTSSSGIFSTTLNSNLYQLQLDIEPAEVGNNDLHLYAYTPTGAPATIKEWKASAALPARAIEPIDVPLLGITDSHATGSVTLPTAGTWQFRFTLRVSDFDEATVSTTVTVRS